MPLEFSASAAAESAAVGRFLATVFRTTTDAAFLTPEVLGWKYFQPRPAPTGRSSVVFKTEGEIVAHAGTWPVTYAADHDDVRGAHVIDWASGAPGAGVLLLRKLLERFEFLMTVGGSEATRAILPRMGYEHRGDAEMFARVLRPWRQARLRPRQDWKAPLRLARNLGWSAAALPRLQAPWSSKSVTRFDSGLDPLLQSTRFRRFLAPRRTTAMLHDLLACPGAAVRGFELHHAGTLRGYVLTSRVLGQTRIADLFVNSENEADWVAAIAAAVASAARDPEACEIVAQSSIPLLHAALVQCGFRPRSHLPIFILDPEKRLPADATLSIQMMDGDAAFLATPEAPFLT